MRGVDHPPLLWGAFDLAPAVGHRLRLSPPPAVRSPPMTGSRARSRHGTGRPRGPEYVIAAGRAQCLNITPYVALLLSVLVSPGTGLISTWTLSRLPVGGVAARGIDTIFCCPASMLGIVCSRTIGLPAPATDSRT